MSVSKEDLGELVNIAEECNEVAQVCMKIIRFGWDSYNPNDKEKTPNKALLELEVGNLLAMLDRIELRSGIVQEGRIRKATAMEKNGTMLSTAPKDEKLEAALKESQAYITMGAGEEVLKDICEDHDVKWEDMVKALGWD